MISDNKILCIVSNTNHRLCNGCNNTSQHSITACGSMCSISNYRPSINRKFDVFPSSASILLRLYD